MSTLNAEGLQAAEESRRLAMQNNDLAALAALLADDLVYGHSTGGTDTKESLMQKLSGGMLRYEKVEFLTPEFSLIGTAGLVNAFMNATVTGAGGANRRVVANSYLGVWEHTASGWKMKRLQGTPKPAPAP